MGIEQQTIALQTQVENLRAASDVLFGKSSYPRTIQEVADKINAYESTRGLESMSWEEIAQISQDFRDGYLTAADARNKYLGSYKMVKVSGYGEFPAIVVGIDHYKADAGNALFTFALYSGVSITTKWDETSYSDDYGSSDLKNFLNNELQAAMESDLMGVVKTTNVKYMGKSRSSLSLKSTSQKLFVPSIPEFLGTERYTEYTDGSQLEYFTDITKRQELVESTQGYFMDMFGRSTFMSSTYDRLYGGCRLYDTEYVAAIDNTSYNTNCVIVLFNV